MDFFAFLNEPAFRREGRKRAEKVLVQLIESAQTKLEQGDLTQAMHLKTFLTARRYLDQNVSPRLVLGNVALKLNS